VYYQSEPGFVGQERQAVDDSLNPRIRIRLGARRAIIGARYTGGR